MRAELEIRVIGCLDIHVLSDKLQEREQWSVGGSNKRSCRLRGGTFLTGHYIRGRSHQAQSKRQIEFVLGLCSRPVRGISPSLVLVGWFTVMALDIVTSGLDITFGLS